MDYEVRKQFIHQETGVCQLVSDEDCFVPEMSLPIQDILNQFAYVDNMRVADLAKQGYEVANEDEDDFSVLDPAALDLAERDALVDEAKTVVDKVRKARSTRKKTVTPEDTPEDTPE